MQMTRAVDCEIPRVSLSTNGIRSEMLCTVGALRTASSTHTGKTMRGSTKRRCRARSRWGFGELGRPRRHLGENSTANHSHAHVDVSSRGRAHYEPESERTRRVNSASAPRLRVAPADGAGPRIVTRAGSYIMRRPSFRSTAAWPHADSTRRPGPPGHCTVVPFVGRGLHTTRSTAGE